MTVTYALPYFTCGKVETEIIVSNPTSILIHPKFTIFDDTCRPKEESGTPIPPNCTQVIDTRKMVSGHAGFVLLEVELPQVVHLVYLRPGRHWWSHWFRPTTQMLGAAFAGDPYLFIATHGTKARIYRFGYRTSKAHGATATVFLSNPNPAMLVGTIQFYNTACDFVIEDLIEIAPGCTQEYACPRDTLGYGAIHVEHHAVVNVLHFDASTTLLMAAELVSEDHGMDPR